MDETVIKIEGLKKQYRLGAIGGGTLTADLKSWWARKRGKEDPNLKLGMEQPEIGAAFYALKGIDLEVKKGEALGIIGHNGAGKSTLLKLLSRVTAPTDGRICINGRIASMLEVGTGFHPELTGRENIYMNGAILGMQKAEIDQKIEDIIDFSECRQFIDTPVKRYSSGMYVKLAFAVAAHLDAEIMIMDEVLAVGDMRFQQKSLGKMGDAAVNDSKTVLYVSHNMNTIRSLCTRCIVLEHGNIIFDGKTDEAINVYMDTSGRELKPVYDVRNAKRPGSEFGKKILITCIRFKEKKEAVYKEGESIFLEIEMEAKHDLEDLRLYCPLRYADSTPVALIESDIFLKKAEAGGKYSIVFEISLNQLVAGKYYLFVSVFSLNEFGTNESYDQEREKIFFELEKDESVRRLNWSRSYWGSIRFCDVKVLP